jgi:hypothetical protein
LHKQNPIFSIGKKLFFLHNICHQKYFLFFIDEHYAKAFLFKKRQVAKRIFALQKIFFLRMQCERGEPKFAEQIARFPTISSSQILLQCFSA